MLTRRQLLKSLAIAPFVPAIAQPKWRSYSAMANIEDGVWKQSGPWVDQGFVMSNANRLLTYTELTIK